MKKTMKEIFRTGKMESEMKNPSKKTKYRIIIGLIALLFIIVGNAFTSAPEKQQNTEPMLQENQETKETFSDKNSKARSAQELEKSYEKDLETMLDKIKGVSETEVMVNLDSTKVKIYEKNLITGEQITAEMDKNGGSRKIEDHTNETQVVIVRQGEKEVPLLTQTKKPDVRGVFVVAKGVDHATVKQWVVESVSRVLDVPTHKVTVMPKK